METWLQYHCRCLSHCSLLLDASCRSNQFLSWYSHSLNLSRCRHMPSRPRSVPSFTFRTLLRLKMVSNVTEIFCHCSQFLLKYYRTRIWWNINSSLYWIRLNQNKFLNLHHSCHIDCYFYHGSFNNSESEEENWEIQEIFVRTGKTTVATEVQYIQCDNGFSFSRN